jgi:predicted phage tail protein
MPRGGYREKAGRKSGWNHSETTVIRVPQALAQELLEIAKTLDRGESLDSITESKSQETDSVTESNSDLVMDSVKHILGQWKSKADAASPKNSNWLKARQILGDLEPVVYEGKILESVTQSKMAPGQMSLLEESTQVEDESVTDSSSTCSEIVADSKELDVENDTESKLSPKDSVTDLEEWLTTRQCWERLGMPDTWRAFRGSNPERLFDRYGVQADPRRKQPGKKNHRWMRLSKSRPHSFQSPSLD